MRELPIAGAAVPLSTSERERFAKDGAYRPTFEHDACGVGFVADVLGKRSHALVEKALVVLANLEHRGAAASDPLTGDGAGLLIQIPHRLLEDECARLGIDLGQQGHYGLGMVFMPRDEDTARRAREVIARAIEEEGQCLLGTREVPTDASVLGPAARASLPRIEQVFVGPGTLELDDQALERRLYVIRKRIESELARTRATEDELPYFASFSTRTVVYKGLLTPEQLPRFYRDLGDERAESALAILHQRFSTNTFPSWSRAHPYRRIAHNGEINTLRGNVSWMKAREAVLRSPTFGDDIEKLTPIVDVRGSDSAQFDDVLELLVHTGRSLPHAVMMMIPEAFRQHTEMSDELRAFYEYHACAMEPWDGPACVVFSDGVRVGAVLDRNGLRPARYVVTHDGLVVMASETGVLDLPSESIAQRDRLRPGRMFLVDTGAGRILPDAEIKHAIARRRPYRRWIDENLVRLDALDRAGSPARVDDLPTALASFAYSREDVRDVLRPMAENGEEPIGSMGNDAPPAALSTRPQLVFGYFRQLFAQVTNPPIDPIREALVMSLVECIGPESNLFEESPAHVRKLELRSPILTCEELERIRSLDRPSLRAATVSCVVPVDGARIDLAAALDRIGENAREAVRSGATILVLSDREALGRGDMLPIPSLLAVAAVHHGLHAAGLRQGCGLVVESGEPREVMHFALLIGYGAGAVCPYLALDAITQLAANGELAVDADHARANFAKAIEKGLAKVLSKMGISTLQSYRGAQIFECLGLDEALVARFFAGTPVHLPGLGLADLERELLARRTGQRALRVLPETSIDAALSHGGQYRQRRDGEHHAWGPGTLALLQHAVRSADREKFRSFARRADDEAREGGFVRGLFDFVPSASIAIDEVEPVSSIVRRFKTGAMSFGSISKEAHETLALAMNTLGARSNTGEGGEDPARYVPDSDGRSRRSAIKQIASGRFGVTTEYLVQADELQIKVAQGAKPGEGGQLPAKKVDAEIARVRHATVGVGLVSPPPHHDIYSIEDLAELIFDLKNANPRAEVSVKLVAEAGVGTVAAGVAKSKADVIVIAGDAGGTGASPISSVKHAGIPWEIGLAETQQTLVLNGLRSRVRLETDGQLKTARDVVIAALLGAEEMAFGTAALVSMGCVMMRACHLDTCPVGVATQDPTLRARFAGEPEHVITFFTFLAEEVRALMATLGFRTFDEMVGRVERLRARVDVPNAKARKLRVDRLLLAPPDGAVRRRTERHDHELELAMDTVLIEQARAALEHGEPVELEMPIRNVHRAATTMLSSEIVRRRGGAGLPDETIRIRFSGSAGQSFGAFLARGVDVTLVGDANDGFGKSLSGGTLVVHPSTAATFAAEENVIIGNVALYGATSGTAFVRGLAGERFAVRNSGAIAVVEGVGDHGCEYMTGGRVVVLGAVGRNFAAGMSGGIAYVLETDVPLATRVNGSTIELEALGQGDRDLVRSLVHRHYQRTMSAIAWRVLSGWKTWSRRFVRVMPIEYKRALASEHASQPIERTGTAR
jgi:glutamate synthase domain-containing protein 2/glutamate synthase domain-containing protein 1/glutamate synthase domain-containing protein 3